MTPAKPRRPHGTGSIYQRASDGKWVATIEAGWTAKGTRRRITLTGKTEAEVRRKQRDRQRQIAQEGLPTAGTGRATVKTWADEWLQIHARQVRPKAYQSDASQVRHWIVPTIGHRRLTELTPADVRAVTRAILTKGLATSTAIRAQAVLTKMLRDAILEGHQVPDRVLLTPAPTAAETDRDAIPLPDALTLLDAASTAHGGSRWVAAFLQGMRQGECLGLTWDAINLERTIIGPTGVEVPAPVMDVSWQLQPLPYEHACPGGDKAPSCGRRAASCPQRRYKVPDGYESRQLHLSFHLVRPKTKQGKRIIPLVPWMVAALEGWRQVAPVNPWGLVWPRVTGRGMVLPQTSSEDRDAWFALQDTARVAHVDGDQGRRYALHEARHTTATLLQRAGVDDTTLTAILGHSSILSTNRYLHTDDERTWQAMEKVATRLGLTTG